ncbi:MAG: YbaK/EbsC family protein [Bacilli bacterium]
MSEVMNRITKFLDENNFEYEVIEHVPVMTALPAIPELVERGYADIKNLLLTDSKGKYFHVCSHVEKEFKIKDIANMVECNRLSFVSEEELDNKYHVYPGIVSILNLIEGNRENVTVILDKDLTKENKICFHPNQNDHMYAFKLMEAIKLLKFLKVPYKMIKL